MSALEAQPRLPADKSNLRSARCWRVALCRRATRRSIFARGIAARRARAGAAGARTGVRVAVLFVRVLAMLVVMRPRCLAGGGGAARTRIRCAH